MISSLAKMFKPKDSSGKSGRITGALKKIGQGVKVAAYQSYLHSDMGAGDNAFNKMMRNKADTAAENFKGAPKPDAPKIKTPKEVPHTFKDHIIPSKPTPVVDNVGKNNSEEASISSKIAAAESSKTQNNILESQQSMAGDIKLIKAQLVDGVLKVVEQKPQNKTGGDLLKRLKDLIPDKLKDKARGAYDRFKNRGNSSPKAPTRYRAPTPNLPQPGSLKPPKVPGTKMPGMKLPVPGVGMGGGMLSGLARFAGPALGVAAAGYAGWKAGGMLNDYVLNPLAEKATGTKGATVGSAIYDGVDSIQSLWGGDDKSKLKEGEAKALEEAKAARVKQGLPPIPEKKTPYDGVDSIQSLRGGDDKSKLEEASKLKRVDSANKTATDSIANAKELPDVGDKELKTSVVGFAKEVKLGAKVTKENTGVVAENSSVLSGTLKSMGDAVKGFLDSDFVKGLMESDIMKNIGSGIDRIKAWAGNKEAKQKIDKRQANSQLVKKYDKDKLADLMKRSNAGDKDAKKELDAYNEAYNNQATAVDRGANAVEHKVEAVVQTGKAAVKEVKETATNVGQSKSISEGIGAVKTGAGKVGKALSGDSIKNRELMAKSMTEQGITDPGLRASLMAQVEVESGFQAKSESMNYTAEGLKATFGKRITDEEAQKWGRGGGNKANQEAIANKVYGGRMGNTEEGDGYKFRGRGMIQLTGKDNYRAAGKDLGIDLENNPDLANDPENAAKLAVWYAKKNGAEKAYKEGGNEAVGKLVNIGSAKSKKTAIHADKREEAYQRNVANGEAPIVPGKSGDTKLAKAEVKPTSVAQAAGAAPKLTTPTKPTGSVESSKLAAAPAKPTGELLAQSAPAQSAPLEQSGLAVTSATAAASSPTIIAGGGGGGGGGAAPAPVSGSSSSGAPMIASNPDSSVRRLTEGMMNYGYS